MTDRSRVGLVRRRDRAHDGRGDGIDHHEGHDREPEDVAEVAHPLLASLVACGSSTSASPSSPEIACCWSSIRVVVVGEPGTRDARVVRVVLALHEHARSALGALQRVVPKVGQAIVGAREPRERGLTLDPRSERGGAPFGTVRPRVGRATVLLCSQRVNTWKCA